MMNFERAKRTVGVLGDSKFAKLTQLDVLICGVGGVGGFAAEHLARSGVGIMTLVDGDVVDISNMNRQIAATDSSLGKFKCDVLKSRFLEINPDAKINTYNTFLRTEEDISALLDKKFDYVIDAIDDVPVKVELIASCVERGIPLISSMGAAGKLDISQIKVADISKTTDCPLARVVRRKLRERGISKGVLTVFSTEDSVPAAVAGEKPGSLSHVVATFGAFCAQCVIGSAVKSQEE